MVEIEFMKKKENNPDHPKDWDPGYYLCKDKDENSIIIFCKSGSNDLTIINEQDYPDFNDKEYKTFFRHYILIGKIKNFKISEIQLEK